MDKKLFQNEPHIRLMTYNHTGQQPYGTYQNNQLQQSYKTLCYICIYLYNVFKYLPDTKISKYFFNLT